MGDREASAVFEAVTPEDVEDFVQDIVESARPHNAQSKLYYSGSIQKDRLGDLEMGSKRIYAGFCQPFAEDELSLLRRFVIADAYARFLRARGEPGELRLAVECLEEGIELEATRRGLSPQDALDEYLGRLRGRFQSLEISCDWDQVVRSSDQDHRLRTQQMFLRLLEEGTVYESGGGADPSQWLARTSRLAERCDRETEASVDWSAEAVGAQRTALGRVDGVEIRAVLPGAGDLVVFTPYGDSIEEATFVAVSPNHPEVEALATVDELARLRDSGGKLTMVQTSLRVALPGVDALLPLVLTRSVDARFGPTAALGVPGRDDVDRRLNAQLKPLRALSMGAVRVRSDPKPATRYRLSDLPVSRDGGGGIPVPIVRCQSCGAVPSPSADLPVEPPEPGGDLGCECPRCGGPARREEASIEPSFAGMWLWPAICSTEDQGWASCQVIWSSEGADRLLQQRLAAHILAGLDRGEPGGDGEPFAGVLMHGALNGEEAEAAINTAGDLDEYVAGTGGDAARLAILSAGSPGRSTHLYAHLLRHAERFIGRVREQVGNCGDHFASGQIDRSTRSRRRLAAWSQVATDRVAMHLEGLEMHKAVYDVMHFQGRIEAFEAICRDHDGPTDSDRDAIAWALVQLGRIGEPLTPHLATELNSGNQ